MNDALSNETDPQTDPDGGPEVLAAIPARGGSKGLPRKNVRPVAGHPLLCWMVEAALQARAVDRLVVSTDDDEIADVARGAGAGVIDRPAALSGDEASSEAALLHALDHLRETDGYDPDVLAFLQCTAPLTRAEDIDATVRALVEREADTAFAAVPFHGFLWTQEGEGAQARPVGHRAKQRLRRQDRTPHYVEAGAVYAMRTAGFRAAEHRFFGKTVLHALPGARRLEVDDAADLERADVLLRRRARRRRRAQAARALPTPLEAVVFDFDGVFTDNKVIVYEDEREAVRCDRRDGFGVERLREQLGVPMLILSRETHPVVRARARKLDLDILNGTRKKRAVLQRWLDEHALAPERVVFVGNDLNDRACLDAVGCGVAVADAYPAVRRAADLVLERQGGNGAVRELCDLILEVRDS